MDFTSVVITGGAGFVGASLAVRFKQALSGLQVTAVDNLKRRGSELNLPRLRTADVRFVHGDIRCPEDLDGLPDFDLLVDCAAEPSVQAGLHGSPRYVLDTNLTGTLHCLEAARTRHAAVLFLSTSRVYPIPALNGLPFHEEDTRFRWDSSRPQPGFSAHGVAETFPLDGARSFYGASKLAGELLVQEYVFNTGLRAIINRCGILAGPWQMGKVDQGVITLWVARHHFQQPLQYVGFGGRGKQVRDLLHIDDLFDLLMLQMESPAAWNGSVYNVGGGVAVSVSLRELTDLCEKVTGRSVNVGSVPETSPVDVRIYLGDLRKVEEQFGWRPSRDVARIVCDIHDWIRRHHDLMKPILG
jgi:CDP-paratose 2-epimerase